jgi:hypothetical protein
MHGYLRPIAVVTAYPSGGVGSAAASLMKRIDSSTWGSGRIAKHPVDKLMNGTFQLRFQKMHTKPEGVVGHI